jgi:CRP-like cAMP-binding protein
MSQKIFVTDAQVKAAQMLVDRDKALGRQTDVAIRKIADHGQAGQGHADSVRPEEAPPGLPVSTGRIAVDRATPPQPGGRLSSLALPLGRRLKLKLGIYRSAAPVDYAAGGYLAEPDTFRSTGFRFWDALDASEREALISLASWQTFAPGDRLMQEGEQADHVIVIFGGRTKISVNENGRERVLAIRGLGQLVGERAAQRTSTRSATVTALDMVWALVAQAKDFAAFIANHSRVQDILERQLYDRLTEPPVEYQGHDAGQARSRRRQARTTATTGRQGSGPGTGPSRHRQEPLNGENCTVLLFEVVKHGAGAPTDDDRRIIREALSRMTHEALQGIPEVRTEDRGDGFLAVLPPNISTAELTILLIKELPVALEWHDSSYRGSARFQLRLAVNFGPVFSNSTGFYGEAIDIASRLLEGPHLEEAAVRDAESLIVISPFVYETVVRYGPDLGEAASYTQARVEVKGASTDAWMKVVTARPT